MSNCELTEAHLAKLSSQGIQARSAILHMTSLAASGHPGGSMSTLDFLLCLYSEIKHFPKDPLNENRDIVVMSHGHVSPAVYSTLALNGYFEIEEMVSQFRLTGSRYEGHVEPDVPGIEWATGNLGQGLSAGCGFALSAKLKKNEQQVYVLMGDGEQQKGQLSEARRFAVKYNLNNLTAFCDYNKLQISGKCEDVMPQNIRAEYEACGWEVIEIDGHSFREITLAIRKANAIDAPVLILGRTHMGKGVKFMENDNKWHGQALPLSSNDGHDLAHALNELGVENKIEYYAKLRSEFTFDKCIQPDNTISDFDINTGKHIHYEDKTDNRSAWGNAVADIATINKEKEYLPMVVFDCDLAGSVKTAKFSANSPENFIQTGIMEHHAAVCAGAMSKSGFQTFFSDFGVFGIDETYNQHRLNDINGTNLKIMLTHVGIDVGEDGKTHQCIDYLGLVRNMFNFRCIVPADPNQTDHIVRWVSSKRGNFLVPMGRSKLNILRNENGEAVYNDAYQFVYGKADKLREGDQASLIVMGTLTNTAIETADMLKSEGINIQVWNVSCPQEIDLEMLRLSADTGRIFTLEDHNVHTGLASCIQEAMITNKIYADFKAFGAVRYPVSGKSTDVFKFCGLDKETIFAEIKNRIEA